MFAKVLFVACALVAFAICEEITIENSIILPEEKFNNLRTAWERHDMQNVAEDLNSIVDEIVEDLDNFMIQTGLDPTELDEIHEGFEFKILLITYHGELDLTDGWLQDISTLHRVGEVTLTLQGTGKIVTLSIPLGFDDLMFTYLYSAKLMNIGPTGGLDGKVKNIECSLIVDYDLNTNLLSLNSFKITKSGSISLKFSGNALTDWMVNIFTSVVTTILHNLILGIASAVIANNLEDVIDHVNDMIANGNLTASALPYN